MTGGGRPTTRTEGAAAEERAVRFLEEIGYTVLERNYACRQGEIDIIAEEDSVLCFVEVRSRASNVHGDPLETITATKRRRIGRTAQHYLMARNISDRACRFDVVTSTANQSPSLIRNAFTLTD